MKNISIVKIQQVKDGSVKYEAMSSPSPVVSLVKEYLKGTDREHFGVICLNCKNGVNNITTVSIGTVDQTIVVPRDVFKTAILSNAVSVILFHNHPSSNSTPSREDKKLTADMVSAGELLRIKVFDHIIIAENGYYSFREENLIN